MKNKIIASLLVVLMIVMYFTSSLAFSDDLFSFDLPSSYTNLTYQGNYVFANTNDSNKGFVIIAKPNTEIKKSVWKIDKSDLDKLVRTLGYKADVISTNRKAKLGKEKAVELVLKKGNEYMDLYILASNKYIYAVMFNGKSEADLKNDDYSTIKNSFKLKDRTTNYQAIYYIVIIIIAVISMYFRNKKNSKKKLEDNPIDNSPMQL